MNTKEIGNKLENYLAELFKEIDSKCRVTKASGACSQKGDLVLRGFKVEAKVRDKENCIINHKVWRKLLKQLNIYNQEIPLLILQNKYKEIFAVLDIKDLIRILKERK